MRQVIVYPGEAGYWVVECPSLPGCISQGKTTEEAIANIKEAIQGYIEALEKDGLPVPEEPLEERASRGSQERFRKAMSKVADIEPDESDNL